MNELAIFGIMIVLFGIMIVINNVIEFKNNTNKLKLTYDEAMSILMERIQEEFKYKYLLDYKIKDVRVIYDIKKDTADMTKKILESFSSELVESLTVYHTDKYIVQIITREVEILLLDYTDKFKISSK